MIISRAPVRITLGGGGTDLPSYYNQRGEGFTLSGCINKYVYVGAYKQFYPDIILKYSKLEHVKDVDDIKHQLFKYALKHSGIHSHIELTSLADVPARTGLGSSGAFLVSLLNTLHEFQQADYTTDKRNLAREACNIELNQMKLHEGKQDKYACALGGIKAFTYHETGHVSIESLVDEDVIMEELSNNLYLFYTGVERKNTASAALKKLDNDCKNSDRNLLGYLDQIRDIGYKSSLALKARNYDAFGRLLDDHWDIKKSYAPKTSSERIDNIYDIAKQQGALGGKLIGAGTGSFMLFYHNGNIKDKWAFTQSMNQLGLQEFPFEFVSKGVETVLNE